MYVKSVSKSHKVESELWITQVSTLIPGDLQIWKISYFTNFNASVDITTYSLNGKKDFSTTGQHSLIKFHNTHPNCDFIDNHDYKILDENKT